MQGDSWCRVAQLLIQSNWHAILCNMKRATLSRHPPPPPLSLSLTHSGYHSAVLAVIQYANFHANVSKWIHFKYMHMSVVPWKMPWIKYVWLIFSNKNRDTRSPFLFHVRPWNVCAVNFYWYENIICRMCAAAAAAMPKRKKVKIHFRFIFKSNQHIFFSLLVACTAVPKHMQYS